MALSKRRAFFDWEFTINKKFMSQPWLYISNDVDDEDPPPDYEYIDFCISKWLDLDDTPVFGCECERCPSDGKCCPEVAVTEARVPYTEDGLLNLTTVSPIYECNKRCKCGDDCINRVVQKGIRHRMEIFKTNTRGWGVRTLEFIKKGEFVIEYVGEILVQQEVDQREQFVSNETTYAFELDFDNTDSPYVVDAAQYGNASRFINHSCSPNLVPYPVYVNLLNAQVPRLAFFAIRDIPAGEELTFCYAANRKRSKSVKRIKCLCGADNCRKYL